MNDSIQLFTDGSSRGNPGPGGYGVVLKYQNFYKEYSEGFRLTTNNRMELLAVIKGLELLKTNAIPVKIISDSKYVIDAISKGWIHNWLRTNFKGKKNKDLWLRYIEVSKNYDIELIWIKGHNGHPENEKCDELAVKSALDKQNLAIDYEYEREAENSINFD